MGIVGSFSDAHFLAKPDQSPSTSPGTMAPEERSLPATRHRFQRQGFSYERLIKFFFASNAGLTIVILILIIVFLLKEGLGFFPGYRRELETYRIAGLEFVDISRKNLTSHEQLTSLLNRAYFAEINGKSVREMRRTQEASALFNAFTDQIAPTRDLILNNPQGETDGNSGMLASLRANFEIQRAKALDSPLPTPHLTADERKQLIESLRTRPAEATDDPPLVAALAGEFAASQQKNSEPLQAYRATIDVFEAAGSDLGSAIMEMTELVTATKEKLQSADILEKDRRTLLAAPPTRKIPPNEKNFWPKPRPRSPKNRTSKRRCRLCSNAGRTTSASTLNSGWHLRRSSNKSPYPYPNPTPTASSTPPAAPGPSSSRDSTPHRKKSTLGNTPIRFLSRMPSSRFSPAGTGSPVVSGRISTAFSRWQSAR